MEECEQQVILHQYFMCAPLMNHEKIVNQLWNMSWADFVTCVTPIMSIQFLILVSTYVEQKSRKQKLTPALQGYETFFIS